MPLVESTLKNFLKTRIESRLKQEFKSSDVKNSLIKRLDGGEFSGKLTNATNIHEALLNIDSIAKGVPTTEGSNFPSIMKKVTANEWSNAISNSICEWMSDTIASILAEELSTIISNEITKYIKTATIDISSGNSATIN